MILDPTKKIIVIYSPPRALSTLSSMFCTDAIRPKYKNIVMHSPCNSSLRLSASLYPEIWMISDRTKKKKLSTHGRVLRLQNVRGHHQTQIGFFCYELTCNWIILVVACNTHDIRPNNFFFVIYSRRGDNPSERAWTPSDVYRKILLCTHFTVFFGLQYG